MDNVPVPVLTKVDTISSTHLAEHTGNGINKVHYAKIPAVVTRRGKPIVLIIPVEQDFRVTHESGEEASE